ncbi:hypothetical protein IE81DRAFT_364926 [Ceraceosorus guamensis]|uniref:Arrestin-like N-terminal domain-containing protein n=1 Tax=Ceraceosorus guamensis TaxID=1522189 RepID=A0A316W6M8_9BASI|nr:hypothetical protein IE81DRAFT_364926 [Ceraceosorus guamensis]PWN44411.1 hypothetical protein IE81DRAFT_364926 [Ceraceosorus guamensis]
MAQRLDLKLSRQGLYIHCPRSLAATEQEAASLHAASSTSTNRTSSDRAPIEGHLSFTLPVASIVSTLRVRLVGIQIPKVALVREFDHPPRAGDAGRLVLSSRARPANVICQTDAQIHYVFIDKPLIKPENQNLKLQKGEHIFAFTVTPPRWAPPTQCNGYQWITYEVIATVVSSSDPSPNASLEPLWTADRQSELDARHAAASVEAIQVPAYSRSFMSRGLGWLKASSSEHTSSKKCSVRLGVHPSTEGPSRLNFLDLNLLPLIARPPGFECRASLDSINARFGGCFSLRIRVDPQDSSPKPTEPCYVRIERVDLLLRQMWAWNGPNAHLAPLSVRTGKGLESSLCKWTNQCAIPAECRQTLQPGKQSSHRYHHDFRPEWMRLAPAEYELTEVPAQPLLATSSSLPIHGTSHLHPSSDAGASRELSSSFGTHGPPDPYLDCEATPAELASGGSSEPRVSETLNGNSDCHGRLEDLQKSGIDSSPVNNAKLENVCGGASMSVWLQALFPTPPLEVDDHNGDSTGPAKKWEWQPSTLQETRSEIRFSHEIEARIEWRLISLEDGGSAVEHEPQTALLGRSITLVDEDMRTANLELPLYSDVVAADQAAALTTQPS